MIKGAATKALLADIRRNLDNLETFVTASAADPDFEEKALLKAEIAGLRDQLRLVDNKPAEFWKMLATVIKEDLGKAEKAQLVLMEEKREWHEQKEKLKLQIADLQGTERYRRSEDRRLEQRVLDACLSAIISSDGVEFIHGSGEREVVTAIQNLKKARNTGEWVVPGLSPQEMIAEISDILRNWSLHTPPESFDSPAFTAISKINDIVHGKEA